jgi:two-component system sensor histidine kinase RegB
VGKAEVYLLDSELSSGGVLAAMNTTAQYAQLQFPWLIRLRWVAIIGQVLTIGVTYLVVGVDLPLSRLFLVSALTVLVNVIAIAACRMDMTLSTGWNVSFLALDIGLLTALLALSGGVHNPFSVFYIVHVMLAALLLPGPFVWGLGALTIGCFASLVHYYVPLPELSHQTHLYGRGVAFAMVAVVSAFFVWHVSAALRAQEARLARTERLASLASLVAGATHELATPLSTIAVIAKELERAMESEAAPRDWVQDVQLLQAQVERCRTLLRDMSAEAGQVPGEAWTEIPPHTLFARVLAQIDAAERRRIAVEVLPESARVSIPAIAFERAVVNLVRNALEASAPAAAVLLRYERRTQRHCISVVDRGKGIPRTLLEHLGEPFVTTKTPGHGLGLGVFTAKTLVERLGGELHVESAAGQGTTVHMEWPL